MCSGRREREVFLKEKLSFHLLCCLTCCHHLNSLSLWSRPAEEELRRFFLSTLIWLLFGQTLPFLWIQQSLQPVTRWWSRKKTVFTSLRASYLASRELQHQLCLHSLCDSSAFIYTDSLDLIKWNCNDPNAEIGSLQQQQQQDQQQRLG